MPRITLEENGMPASALVKGTLLLSALLGTTAGFAQEGPKHWWSGTRITPGVGWRALNVTLNNPSGEANLQTSFGASVFGSLNLESRRIPLGRNFAISLLGHSATVNADQQFVKDTSGDSGSRQSFGTSLSGHYSYLAPALTWGNRNPKGSGLEISFGMGMWNGRFTGDAIYAPDTRPTAGMPRTPVEATFNRLGYDTRIGLYSGHWSYVVTVGGPFPYTEKGTRYQFQQIALIVGYEFEL